MPREEIPQDPIFVVTDDFDGSRLPDETEPLVVSVEGIKYELWLSENNKKSVTDLLSKIQAKGTKVSGGGTSVNTHGHSFDDVRTWAVAKKKKAKSGQLIQPTTRVLHQGIWDQYDKEHKKS